MCKLLDLNEKLKNGCKYKALHIYNPEEGISERDKPFFLDAAYKFPIIDASSVVGIEIEMENVPTPPNIPGWETKRDGSLRNNGIEYVSYPTRARQIPLSLMVLKDQLGTTPEFSTRTSVHLHINVRNLTYSEAINFILLYIATERLFYSFIGNGRDNNIFCNPLHSTDLIKDLAISMQKWAIPGNFFDFTCMWPKYTGLNISPVSRNADGIFEQALGTFEFRQMEGNLDVERITTWMNLILSLKKYARQRPTKVLIEELCSLNTNSQYLEFLVSVFGFCYPKILHSNYIKEFELGVNSIKFFDSLLRDYEPPLFFSVDMDAVYWIPQHRTEINPKKVHLGIPTDDVHYELLRKNGAYINVNKSGLRAFLDLQTKEPIFIYQNHRKQRTEAIPEELKEHLMLDKDTIAYKQQYLFGDISDKGAY